MSALHRALESNAKQEFWFSMLKIVSSFWRYLTHSGLGKKGNFLIVFTSRYICKLSKPLINNTLYFFCRRYFLDPENLVEVIMITLTFIILLRPDSPEPELTDKVFFHLNNLYSNFLISESSAGVNENITDFFVTKRNKKENETKFINLPFIKNHGYATANSSCFFLLSHKSIRGKVFDFINFF